MGINLFGELGFDEDSEEVVNARAAAATYASAMDALIEARKRAAVSQKVVAKRMATSQSAISELESTASDARVSTLIRYAQAVGATVTINVKMPRRPKEVWPEDHFRNWVRSQATEQIVATESAARVQDTSGMHFQTVSVTYQNVALAA